MNIVHDTLYYSYNIIILMYLISVHEICAVLGEELKVQMYCELMRS